MTITLFSFPYSDVVEFRTDLQALPRGAIVVGFVRTDPTFQEAYSWPSWISDETRKRAEKDLHEVLYPDTRGAAYGDVTVDRSGRTVRFSAPVACAEYSEEALRTYAAEEQAAAGWDPRGYGFYGFQVANGVATWYCAASCD